MSSVQSPATLKANYNQAIIGWKKELGTKGQIITDELVSAFCTDLLRDQNGAIAKASTPIIRVMLATVKNTLVFGVFLAALSIILPSLAYMGHIPLKPLMITMVSACGFSLLLGLYNMKKINNTIKETVRTCEGIDQAFDQNAFINKYGQNYRTDQNSDSVLKTLVSVPTFNALQRAAFAFNKNEKLLSLKMQQTATGGGSQVCSFILQGVSILLVVLTYTGHIPLKTYMGVTVAFGSISLLQILCTGKSAQQGLQGALDQNEFEAQGMTKDEAFLKVAETNPAFQRTLQMLQSLAQAQQG